MMNWWWYKDDVVNDWAWIVYEWTIGNMVSGSLIWHRENEEILPINVDDLLT